MERERGESEEGQRGDIAREIEWVSERVRERLREKG